VASSVVAATRHTAAAYVVASTGLTPGSGRRTIAFMALKIVAAAPLPRAMHQTATAVNSGLVRSIHAAEVRSAVRSSINCGMVKGWNGARSRYLESSIDPG